MWVPGSLREAIKSYLFSSHLSPLHLSLLSAHSAFSQPAIESVESERELSGLHAACMILTRSVYLVAETNSCASKSPLVSEGRGGARELVYDTHFIYPLERLMTRKNGASQPS